MSQMQLAEFPLEIPAAKADTSARKPAVQYGRKWARSEADVPKGRKIVGRTSSGGVYYETSGGGAKAPGKKKPAASAPARPNKTPPPGITEHAPGHVSAAPEGDADRQQAWADAEEKLQTAAAQTRKSAESGVIKVGPVAIDMTKAPDKVPEVVAKADKAAEQLDAAKRTLFEKFMTEATDIPPSREYKETLAKMNSTQLLAHLDAKDKAQKIMDDAELFTVDYFKALSDRYGLPMAAAIWSTGLAGAAAGGAIGSALGIGMVAAPGVVANLAWTNLTGSDLAGGIAGFIAGTQALKLTGDLAAGTITGSVWLGKHLGMSPLIFAGDMWNGIRGMVNVPRQRKEKPEKFAKEEHDSDDQGDDSANADSIDLSSVDMAEVKELAAQEWGNFFAEWFEHLADGGEEKTTIRTKRMATTTAATMARPSSSPPGR